MASLLSYGAGASEGLDSFLKRMMVEQQLKQQQAERDRQFGLDTSQFEETKRRNLSTEGIQRDQLSSTESDRKAREAETKRQHDLADADRNEANTTRTINLRPIGTRVAPEVMKKEVATGAPREVYGEDFQPENMGMEKQTGEVVPPSKSGYDYTGTEPQRDRAATQIRLRRAEERQEKTGDAAIDAKIEQLNQSAQRLEMQGKVNEANIARAAAQAELAKSKVGKDDENRKDRSYQYNNNILNAAAKPLADQAERIGRLRTTIEQQSPAADALIAPELLTAMAGGQGSGLRMNEAEISRIVGGRNQWESLKSRLEAWQLDPSKPFAVTPEQRGQMRALIKAIGDRGQQRLKGLRKAQSDLIDAPDVETHRRIVSGAQQMLNDDDASGGATVDDLVKRLNERRGAQ